MYGRQALDPHFESQCNSWGLNLTSAASSSAVSLDWPLSTHIQPAITRAADSASCCRLAAVRGGGNLVAPVQRVTDFLAGQVSTGSLPSSSYRSVFPIGMAPLPSTHPPSVTMVYCCNCDLLLCIAILVVTNGLYNVPCIVEVTIIMKSAFAPIPPHAWSSRSSHCLCMCAG